MTYLPALETPIATSRLVERLLPASGRLLARAAVNVLPFPLGRRLRIAAERPVRLGARRGSVAIVGAGPGDPELLTLKALRALEAADVVVYDKLVGPRILDLARPDAERIYVGKTKSHHVCSQDEINALVAARARAGRRVVRLKGGDPFIFGRGGEERDYLLRHGVPVEVVPGITAATGCAAATGIALTHRDYAAAATVVTGHGRDGEPDLDWAALARPRHTLVIYMGVSTAGRTAARLIAHGLPAGTPAAIIENGTLPAQKTVVGTLGTLEAMVRDNDITGPAVIVVGEVVRQADAAALPEHPDAVAV